MSRSLRPVVQFAALYLGLLILVIVVQLTLGFDLGQGGRIGAFMGATFGAGHLFAHRFGETPTSRECWKIAAWIVFASLIVSTALGGALILIGGGAGDIAAILGLLGNGPALAVTAVVFAMYFLTARFVFPYAARQALALARKKAEQP